MTPYFFGDSRSPLLGCYTEPSSPARDHGVLLCAPIAQEYLRSHWAMRQLATSLARAGLHVFRFDYGATGDSSGESAAADVTRWQADIELAAQELRDASGARKVSLVGLRLGAPLAMAATRRGLRAETLVLWDPVVSGRSYLAGLERMHEAMLVDEMRFAFSLRREVKRRLAPWLPALAEAAPPVGELLGFPFSAALRAGIEGIDLVRDAASPESAKPLPKRVVLVASEPAPEYDALERALRGTATTVEAHRTSAPGRWAELDEIENALLPADAPRVIARTLAGEAR